ncbi:MAG TPA: S8 family serine peptidase [Saprospiraceae bacterium]|nr:S8 family serine peptidase [Saprospiraceae bacterium]
MIRFFTFLAILIISIHHLFAQTSIGEINFKQGIYRIPDKASFSATAHFTELQSEVIAISTIPSVADPYNYLSHQKNLKVLSKLGHLIYIVLLEQDQLSALQNDYNINGIFSIPGSYKLDKNIEGANSGKYKIITYTPFDQAQLKKYFPDITIIHFSPLGTRNIIDVSADLTQIKEIAELNFIEFISAIPNAYTPINFNKHIFESDGEAQADASVGGLNLNGEGMTLGSGDDGYYKHVDLDDRVINFSAYPTPGGHSAHTSGTIAGAGLLDPTKAGKAAKATLISAYFYDIVTNAASFYSGNDMHVTGNSYGIVNNQNDCNEFGDYNTYSAEIDAQAQTMTDLLHVFAAGNSGGQTCSPYSGGKRTVFDGPQTAKNSITVGALDKNLANNRSGFSSQGPTDDGRLKPEISAIGNAISTGKNDDYFTASGTSMATPSVTGAVGLLQQSYKSQHSNSYPRQDLIKAVICNSANDIGTEGPDFGTGFGIINTSKACKEINNLNNVLNSVTQGSENNISISVPSNTSKLAITICWIDPTANPSVSPELVNDLDLELYDGINTIYPWKLDPTPAGAGNPATRGRDSLNNIEKISVLNPAEGSYTIKVKGTSVMGAQAYAITWYTEDGSMRISAPFAGSKFAPGDGLFPIREVGSVPNNPNSVTQYSTDGGGSWTNFTSFPLIVPNVITNQAQIKVTDNSTGAEGITGNFTIAPIPNNLTASSICPGYANLSWSAIAGATSYNIYKKTGPEMVFLFDTTANAAIVPGLSNSDRELLGVSAVFAGGVESRRSYGVFITANSGSCPWANDLSAIAILAPESGRKFTSTAPGVSKVKLRIKNLGITAATGFNVYFKVNNGTAITEPFVGSVAPGAIADYTFSSTYDFSTVGIYLVEGGIAGNFDAPYTDNNITYATIRHLPNDPVILTNDLNTTFKVDFESALDTTLTFDFLGIPGINRFDYKAFTSSSRARMFVTAGIANSGSKAASLDAIGLNASSTNELIMTANISNYNNSDNIRLDFAYLNHNSTTDPGDKIWIRGGDTYPWIEVYDLNDNQAEPGNYKRVNGLNISQALSGHGQIPQSSFQVKFGQQGIGSIVARDWKGGYTFDDIYLHRVQNDLELTSILNPPLHPCGLGSNENIIVRISNTTNASVSGANFWYKLNNTTFGPYAVGSINANSYVDFTVSGVNLSSTQWYNLSAWIHAGGDTYQNNDTLKNYSFYNSPHIASYPYLESFEAGDGGWHAYGKYSSWAWGSPSKPTINRAANGSNIWSTNLTGTYNNNEASYLESPCFDLSSFTSAANLSFSFANEIESGFDFAWVEYSEDGNTWTKLGSSSSGYNWYNSGGNYWDNTKQYWHVATCPLPLSSITDKSNIRFRFALISDIGLSLEGLSIDDIHIYAPTNIYQGVNTSLTATPATNGWTDFTSGGALVASLKPSGQNLGSTAVGVYFNPNIPTRHDIRQFYLDRNFTIVPVNPVGSGTVAVRLYFTDLESDSCRQAVGAYDKPVDAFELGVTQVSSATDDGVYGNEVDPVLHYFNYANTQMIPYMNGYYVEFEVAGFSEFYLNPGGSNNNFPLPLSLTSFRARYESGHTGLITYQLASTQDIQNISIEKSATVDFSTIRIVQSSNHVTTRAILLRDEDGANTGTFYYRLKATETDGRVYYSRVERILYPASWEAVIYPNPITADFYVQLTGADPAQPVVVDIMDATGRSVHQMSFIPGQSICKRKIQTELAAGVYYFRLTQGDRLSVSRIVKMD